MNQYDDEWCTHNGVRVAKTIIRIVQNELSDREREILTMQYVHGRSTTEIAQELNVNLSTVTRALARAHRVLAKYLKYALM